MKADEKTEIESKLELFDDDWMEKYGGRLSG